MMLPFVGSGRRQVSGLCPGVQAFAIGAVMSLDYASTDEGWIHQLATQATHRHRGIARALLRTAFRTFAERGKRHCGLSTDSRTGALTLYEHVGMSVRSSYTRYTKPLV